MRKYLFIMVAALLLVACGTKANAVVKDKEFTFYEDDFITAYEETNDKNLPTNIGIKKDVIYIEEGTKEETIDFLNAVEKVIDYKEIKRLNKSIMNDEDNIDGHIKANDITIMYQKEYEEDNYNITIVSIVRDEDTTN